jgi:cobalt-zinc-cadmium efflux system outer membrane protein
VPPDPGSEGAGPAAGSGAEDGRSAAIELLAGDEIRLEVALRVADLLEPTLAAERRNIDLAAAAALEARLYPNPSLTIEADEYHTSGPTAGKMNRTVGLSIPIVVSGRLGAAEAVANKEGEIAALEYLAKRREVFAAVRRAFVELLAARQAADLSRESRDIAAGLHEASRARFQAEAIPEMEYLKAAVDLAKAEAEVRQSERDVSRSARALNASMGDPDLPERRPSGRLAPEFETPDAEALRRAMAESHPLLQAAERRGEYAALGVDLAKTERYADPEFAIEGGLDAEDRGIVTAGVRIPLPLWDASRPKIAAAEVRAEQARLRARAKRNELALALGAARREFAAAQDRVQAFDREILPRAHKVLDQTREGYAAGKFGQIDLLDARRTLADARSARLSAVLDLNLAVAELESLTGVVVAPVPGKE